MKDRLQAVWRYLRPHSESPRNIEHNASLATAQCGSCLYRCDDRTGLEACVPGLASFGSAYGASVSDSRLCTYHDRFTSPGDACGAFVKCA